MQRAFESNARLPFASPVGTDERVLNRERVLQTHLQPVTCPRREDLEFGSLLGEGAFARVIHVRDTRNGQEYALKMVDKRQIQAKGRTSSVVAERSFLSSLDHPGIINLRFTFQDEWRLYFVLELVAGGELATQIARMGVCSLEFAQFYAAEIVAVLEYLRAKRVAHRDLKPENILLSTDGHIKIIDFDAAVIVPHEGEGDAAGGCSQGQPTFVGTSFYLAPEVLHNKARPWDAFGLDLWALGCIVYQMLVGRTPFHAKSEYLLFEQILARDFSYPDFFPYDSARDLIDSLLAEEPGDRLGNGREALSELKCHTFFGGGFASFDRLRRQPPPPRLNPRHRPENHNIDRSGCSDGSPTASFDFASSAECTPEVGQGFLARTSTCVTIVLSPESLDDETVDASHQLEPGPQREDQPPRTSVQSRNEPPKAAPRNDSEHSSMQSPQDLRLATQVSPRCSEYKAANWRQIVDVPFASWQLWLSELLRRQMLFRGEDVTICGSVVKRRLPCCRPKVLILTDWPRLLVLDSKGVRLLNDIDLAGHHGGQGLVTVKSSVEFLLRGRKRTYRCCDYVLGAEEWAAKIALASRGYRRCDPGLARGVHPQFRANNSWQKPRHV